MRYGRALCAAVLVVVAATYSCNDSGGGTTTPPPPATNDFVMAVAFPSLTTNFERPLDIQNAGDGSNRLFIVEQRGRIYVMDEDAAATTAKLFLDIESLVLSYLDEVANEEGLLGLTFDPDFSNNGYFYVYYTVLDGGRNSRVSRFTVDAQNPDTTRATTRVDLLTISQPATNHNGGQIAFDANGYLFIAVGDGGSANDPDGNGQNRQTLLGNILRIMPAGGGYTVPPDNPYVGNASGYQEEIWAYGLRNPWRFSIDPVTGWMWCGDVGQGDREEVDIIEKGNNYGWNIMEGTQCFQPPSACDMTGLTLPIFDYDHGTGAASITGGVVYRGTRLPGLVGEYLYADYRTRVLGGIRYDGVSAAQARIIQAPVPAIAGFGVGESREMYIAAFDGSIYQLEENQ